MPQFDNVKTVSSEQVWQQGDKTIWKLGLDIDGQQMEAKTYSKAIAQVGWSGSVESYEKQGRYGVETFVKQPQREGGYGGARASYSGGKKSAPDNPHTMYLSYAKDIAVAVLATGKWDGNMYQTVLEAVEAGGEQLYASRPGAEQKKPSEAATSDVSDPFAGMGVL